MDKTNFENLEIYQLAAKLFDEIWQIVSTWNYFAKETVGKQLVRSVDSLAQISRKDADAEAQLIIGDFENCARFALRNSTLVISRQRPKTVE